MLLANRRGLEAFVAAVVPLSQIRIDAGLLAQASQFTGAAGPLQGAAQHQGKTAVRQRRGEQAGHRFAMVGEGDVSAAGVLTREAPFRFAVANQINLVCIVLAILDRGHTFKRCR
jgi:hypothetical protein